MGSGHPLCFTLSVFHLEQMYEATWMALGSMAPSLGEDTYGVCWH